jgi:hydroxymethylglutaryl-CoA lyase
MRLPTGIDLAALLPTAGFLGEQLGYSVPAMLPRAGVFPWPQEASDAAEPDA